MKINDEVEVNTSTDLKNLSLSLVRNLKEKKKFFGVDMDVLVLYRSVHIIKRKSEVYDRQIKELYNKYSHDKNYRFNFVNKDNQMIKSVLNSFIDIIFINFKEINDYSEIFKLEMNDLLYVFNSNHTLIINLILFIITIKHM